MEFPTGNEIVAGGRREGVRGVVGVGGGMRWEKEYGGENGGGRARVGKVDGGEGRRGEDEREKKESRRIMQRRKLKGMRREERWMKLWGGSSRFGGDLK